MSRSFKKNPICGNVRSSEKLDKRKANRKFRRNPNNVKIIEVSDRWTFSKDGKSYFGNGLDEDLVKKLMRK